MVNHSPRVSMGLPVYNGERFLEETLDSILAQTFEDYEL
ncbi:MAG: glycosyltransferase, partial [Acidobacteriota bacterium]